MPTLSTSAITSEDDFSPIYKGDTLVTFKPQFWQWDDIANAYVELPLSGYTIGMKMSDGTTTKTCSGTWTQTDAAHGKASYQWQSADVDTAGTWQLFITLTDGNGRVGHIDTKTLEIKGAP